MNQLEEYVSKNAAAFDSGVLPEGAEERFLARWDAARRRRRVAIPFAVLAVAASLAAVLFIQGTGTRDWLRKAEQTPEGIYSGYLAAVSSVWEKVGEDEEASETLAILTEETVPLGEQLPSELSDAERTAILRDYYNTLLDGADRIRKHLINKEI